MAQLFKPSANSVAAVSLLATGIGVPAAWVALAALSRSPANTKVDVAINQPVPFSHQHHAWELGIDCRYCHTSVEKSAFAGLPSTETCMSCHSQIWTNSPMLEPVRESYETGRAIHWNYVNFVPQFVFFNHSIHIARGINCNVCHGPVNDMSITWRGNSFQMQWCLQCHRAPERYINTPPPAGMTPRQQVFDLYWKLQTQGTKGLTSDEAEKVAGDFAGNDDPKMLAQGRQLVKRYGIQVMQLSDCNVCHR